MKAEHRKELETNILADKVGRIITGAKQGPSRGFVFYFVIGLALCAAIWVTFRIIDRRRNSSSAGWAAIEDGSGKELIDVAQTPTTGPGKAAQFQNAWATLWFKGLKQLGSSPKQAFAAIEDAELTYKDLATKCKGDPVFEPEALYALAVIEETRLVQRRNRESTQPVIEKYNAVIKASKDSAFAELSKKRIEELEKNERAVLEFYQDLERVLDRINRPFLPPNFDLNNPEDFNEQIRRMIEQGKKK